MRFVVVLALVVACKGDEKSTPATGSGSAPPAGSGSSTGSAVAAGSGSAASGSGSGSGSATAPPPPIDPKVMAARCGEPCLFLVDTPVDKLGDAFKTACKKNMPDLKLTECRKLDVIRKCVFAAHGFVFKSALWKKAYEKKPWYVANAAFRPAQISELEHANVVDLDARAKACKRGITISPTDVKRIRSWLAGLDKGKPALPKVVHVNGAAGKRSGLVALVKRELDGLGVKRIKLGADGSTAEYEDPLPEQLTAALRIPAGAKLRSIRIEQSKTNESEEATVTEGLEIHLIYDDHDQLLAVDASHFLWD
jgi:hypothetical protein